MKSPKPARKYNTKHKGIILIVRDQLQFKSLYPQTRLQPRRLLKLLDVVEEYPRHLQMHTPNNYGKFEDTSSFWCPVALVDVVTGKERERERERLP